MILSPHLRSASPWLDDFARIFDRAFQIQRSAPSNLRIVDAEDAWTLELDFPGRKREAFDLEVVDRKLRLTVREGDDSENRFQLPLGPTVDVTGITSSLEDGILRIRLPRRSKADESTRIKIS